ncbi:MAG: hypothetical protein K2G58_06515 [Alistipes sp.]|nr:hypothetical protein [Alistipes sp.]
MIRLFFLAFCLSATPLHAADNGASWLNRLQQAVRSLGEYEVRFELSTTDGYATTGSCRVSGESYVISLPQARVYCDGKARYEVNDDKREVVVDAVDTESRNLLDNPVRAFDFVGEQYDVRIAAEQPERITLRLTPRSTDALSVIELTLDKSSALPVSVIYGAEDMRIALKIVSFGKSATPFPDFRRADFAGYEWIDFR